MSTGTPKDRPHPAVVPQPQRPPHPATVVQPKPVIGPPARPPHPATVIQRRTPVAAPPARPPHPATLPRGTSAPPGPSAIQRAAPAPAAAPATRADTKQMVTRQQESLVTNKKTAEHVSGLEKIINLANAETLKALGPKQMGAKATKKGFGEMQGYVEYGGVYKGSRQGVHAIVTPAMDGQGTAASYVFPFFTHNTGKLIIRGHLLAKSLGGDGAEPRNVVPLYHEGANLPMYNDFEQKVLIYIRTHGNPVEYWVIPRYGANPVLPVKLELKAHALWEGKDSVIFHDDMATGF